VHIYSSIGQENEDLLIWIAEPGTEYYLHFYVWRNVPFSFKLEAETETVDVAVKKISTKKDSTSMKPCNPDESYDYISKRISIGIYLPLSNN
jgi:hypothetical protein